MVERTRQHISVHAAKSSACEWWGLRWLALGLAVAVLFAFLPARASNDDLNDISPSPEQDEANSLMACAACDALTHRLLLFGNGAAFLASFEPPPGQPSLPKQLAETAFVYDNALVIMALLACDRPEAARLIGDALVHAVQSDRFYRDGRVRNAYKSGPVGREAGPIALPGFWDDSVGQWHEDAFQVGSATGSVTWAALALVALYEATNQPVYHEAAKTVMRWVNTMTIDELGVGGFRGGFFGHEPTPQRFSWKSTEHNTDVYAANRRLGQLSPDGEWQANADEALRFLERMWIPEQGRFLIGTLPDGQTANANQSGLDAQLWPLIAVPEFADRASSVLAWTADQHGVNGGYDFNEDRDGIWIEGTAQAAIVHDLLGDSEPVAELFRILRGHRVGDGLLYASDVDGLTTGLAIGPDAENADFLYYRLPHIGATAWMVLAARRWNPFVGQHSEKADREALACPLR